MTKICLSRSKISNIFYKLRSIFFGTATLIKTRVFLYYLWASFKSQDKDVINDYDHISSLFQLF